MILTLDRFSGGRLPRLHGRVGCPDVCRRPLSADPGATSRPRQVAGACSSVPVVSRRAFQLAAGDGDAIGMSAIKVVNFSPTRVRPATSSTTSSSPSDTPLNERKKADAEFYLACTASTQRIKSRKIRQEYLKKALLAK